MDYSKEDKETLRLLTQMVEPECAIYSLFDTLKRKEVEFDLLEAEYEEVINMLKGERVCVMLGAEQDFLGYDKYETDDDKKWSILTERGERLYFPSLVEGLRGLTENKNQQS